MDPQRIYRIKLSQRKFAKRWGLKPEAEFFVDLNEERSTKV